MLGVSYQEMVVHLVVIWARGSHSKSVSEFWVGEEQTLGAATEFMANSLPLSSLFKICFLCDKIPLWLVSICWINLLLV